MNSYANRGMGLENLIEFTNEIYRAKNLAIVTKRPTPVKIMRTLRGGRVEGFLEKPSTVDFDGIYRGRALAFEAKSTKEAQRFPIKNIEGHQVQYLRVAEKHGAISFVIMEFVKHEAIFYIPASIMMKYWERSEAGGPKSIPFDELNYSCYAIPSTRGVPCDYLAVVDKLLEQKEANAG